MTFISSLLSGPDPLCERVSVSLMTTYACQLACAYCQVRRHNARTTEAVIDDAIDFLGRSASEKLELKFFGGEPLLEFGLLKYAVRRAQRRLGAVKDLQYCLVTNGIALDAEKLAFLSGLPALVVFSFDGDAATHDAFRSGASGSSRHAVIFRNLRRLAGSGTDFFANTVVSPGNLPSLPRNLAYIADLGVKRIQLCYNGAEFWSADDIMRLVKVLSLQTGALAEKGVTFLNASGDSEPVALKTDLIVDTDGQVYMDGAIFMEKRFPGARAGFLLGKASALGKPEDAYADRAEHLRRWRAAFTCAEEEKVFMSTLKAGAALRLLFRGTGSAPRTTAP